MVELRVVGYSNGLGTDELVDGDGTKLRFADRRFDVVAAYGVLRHVPHPQRVLAELLRVARVGMFMSDANNFSQGGWAARAVQQTFDVLSLWPLAYWLKTQGRDYTVSKEDGLAYSYTVFTTGTTVGPNPYRHAVCAALLAMKKGAG